MPEAWSFHGPCRPWLVRHLEARRNSAPDGMSNAWVYNRCNQYTKDTAVRADGMWVLVSGSAQLASGSTEPPVMCSLVNIQKELGDSFQTIWVHTITRGSRGVRVAPAHASAHVLWIPKLVKLEDGADAFTMDCLNMFAPSWEVRDGEAGLECSGFLHPAFEVRLDGNQLGPQKIAEPARQVNPACLFLRKMLRRVWLKPSTRPFFTAPAMSPGLPWLPRPPPPPRRSRSPKPSLDASGRRSRGKRGTEPSLLWLAAEVNDLDAAEQIL